MVVGGVIGCASNGYNMYIASRFILGFGNGLAQMCSPLLLVEIVHPQHRGPVTTIYNCLWNAGALLVSVIGTQPIDPDSFSRSLGPTAKQQPTVDLSTQAGAARGLAGASRGRRGASRGPARGNNRGRGKLWVP